MAEIETFVHLAAAQHAEQSANAFASLLRQDGDQIRRDVFVMVKPEQSASGRIMAGYTVLYPGCSTAATRSADREEVYYFIKGSGIMIVDEQETPVTAGDTMYLKPGPYHGTRNTTDFPLEYFWITIRVD